MTCVGFFYFCLFFFNPWTNFSEVVASSSVHTWLACLHISVFLQRRGSCGNIEVAQILFFFFFFITLSLLAFIRNGIHSAPVQDWQGVSELNWLGWSSFEVRFARQGLSAPTVKWKAEGRGVAQLGSDTETCNSGKALKLKSNVWFAWKCPYCCSSARLFKSADQTQKSSPIFLSPPALFLSGGSQLVVVMKSIQIRSTPLKYIPQK